jgi:hypothetical protein
MIGPIISILDLQHLMNYPHIIHVSLQARPLRLHTRVDPETSVSPQSRLRHLTTPGIISLRFVETTAVNTVEISGEIEVLLLSAQDCLKLCRTPKSTLTSQIIRTDRIATVLHRQGETTISLHGERTITEGLMSHLQ